MSCHPKNTHNRSYHRGPPNGNTLTNVPTGMFTSGYLLDFGHTNGFVTTLPDGNKAAM